MRRDAPDALSRRAATSGSRCAAGRFDQAVGEEMAEREVVAVMRDITERKEQEHALEEARAEAERANAAKSRFLATMSHELRTPLNAIIGFSEMLTKEKSLMIDADRRHEYAQLINDSGHHLLSVVNGILDMSKIESGNFEITPEPFAPKQVIDDCCDLLGYKARETGIELIVRLPDNLPEIVADKRSLHQIMLNLMSNAVKFTKRGGKVTVSASADERFRQGHGRGYRRRHRCRGSAAHRRPVLPGALVLRPASRWHRAWPLHRQGPAGAARGRVRRSQARSARAPVSPSACRSTAKPPASAARRM